MDESKKLQALYNLNLSQTDLLQLLINKIEILEVLLEKHNPQAFDEYQFKLYDLNQKTLPELSALIDLENSKQKKKEDH